MPIQHTNPTAFDVLLISPFERPCHRLVSEGHKAGALPFLDLGRDMAAARRAVARVAVSPDVTWGVRIPEGVTVPVDLLDSLRGRARTLLHGSPDSFVRHEGFVHLVQAVSWEEALRAQSLGADGIILKGAESGGRVGSSNSFILLQQCTDALTIPFWPQGGLGPHGAAAAVAAGARGVVYDAQLALLPELRVPHALRLILKGVNGSESTVAGGYRYLRHRRLPELDMQATAADVLQSLSQPDPPVLAGEDVALADLFVALYGDLATLVDATTRAMEGHLRQAKAYYAFAPDSAFAREHRLRYPILQGPMTRVSDSPDFAHAVAAEGALPSIALAVMKPDDARQVLQQTQARLGDLPWSAGLLGFLPPELYTRQVDVVLEAAPPFVLIAGGRPDQAQFFESRQIGAFLHCPTFRLFEHFVKDGVKRFVFEGRECGGHVGPLSSLTLWEGQISLALETETLDSLSLVFAGGLHDARSAALLAVMCAPLAARGAKLGLLMGTAYLFTEEIVQEGAILPRYQAMVVDSHATALVQTGPGHVTRCLRTAYVDVLDRERERLHAQGKTAQEIFTRLEAMNVGSLRVASKGKKRVDGTLVDVDAATQLAEGMYMVGDVATLRSSVTRVSALHQGIADGAQWLQALPPFRATRRGTPCDIAIVGVAGIFPGALSAEEFWSNVLLGKDCVTEVPTSRWCESVYYDGTARGAAGEKTNSKWGGFIPDFHFDPAAFGIPPQALGSIDPAQLASLLIASRALQDAGYGDHNAAGARTSVIFGVEPGGDLSAAYGLRILLPQLVQGAALEKALDALPRLTEDSFPGVLGNIVSGRISNRLDLAGQNFTIDAACASSLAAIDAAIKELRYGECDMAIAGGVDFHNGINDYLMFSSTHALSSKGRCLTFSDGADGIALGEAAAAVVLKRLEDAQDDGDHIYAVIRGIAGASDGRSLGLTAPRRQGQRRALDRAYRRAGISPQAIGLLEAHGTGTVAGDQTELTTLESVFAAAGSDAGACILGSVKTQIGHTKCAAGMASLIKTAFAIEQGVLPPTLHIDRPNRAWRRERSRFAFHAHPAPWLAQDRKAGVSAFGFGGTNYHLVMDRADQERAAPSPAVWPQEVFLFRGETPAQAKESLARMTAFLDVGRQLRLADVAYSHHLRADTRQPVQVAIVAASIDELRERLTLAENGQSDPRGVFHASAETATGDIAFLFPGQGSQFLRMGGDLFTYFPQTHRWIENEPALLRHLFPVRSFADDERAAQDAALTATEVAQPALGVVSLAVADILRSLGVRPAHLAGHSYGELGALCHAGAIAPADLVAISRQRAASILTSVDPEDPGAMLAVDGDASLVHDVLGPALGGVEIANLNAPQQTVLAGRTAAIAAAREAFTARGVGARLLNVACAFHSRERAGGAAHFGAALAQWTLAAPVNAPVWSNETGLPYAAETTGEQVAQALARQIVASVRFTELIRGMYERGVRTFIEVGAGNVLCGLVNRILDGKAVRCLPVCLRDAAPLKGLMVTIARLAASGVELSLDALFAGRRLREVDLDDTRPLSRSMWIVNGHYARPLFGTLPAQSYNPHHRIDLTPPTTPSVATPHQGDSLALYFDSLNRFIEAQRDVMLEHLGAADRPLRTINPRPGNTATPVLEAPVAPPPVAARPVMDAAGIEIRLRAMISERTGYPLDMLQPELDLEADLGVDSIKRVELLSEISAELGVRRGGDASSPGEEATSFLDQVSRIKTLRGISTWLADFVRQSAPPVAATNTAAAPAAVAAPHVAVDQETITRRLRTLIAERTGYPEDMLDADLDLEADLGVDSIKRVELLSEIGRELGLARGGQDGLGEEATSFLDQVSRIKTLRGISSWLADRVTGGTTSAAAQVPDESPGGAATPDRLAAVLEPDTVPLKVFDVRYVPQALRVAQPALAGKTFHVIDAPDAAAAALTASFASRGIRLAFIGREALRAGMTLDTDGLVYFSHGDVPFDDIRGLLWSLQACDAARMDCVLVVQCATEPLLDEEGRYIAPAASTGAAGFLVSLRWEWPRTRIIRPLVVHDATVLSVQQLAERLVDEVFSEAEPMAQPVAYVNGERHVRRVVPRATPVTATLPLELAHDAVIVVIGGAKGITSWFAEGFAHRYRCRLVVLGRSALPPATDPYPSLETAAQLRQALLASSTPGTSPRQIEQEVRRLLDEKAIRRNLAALQAAGSEVSYWQADVTDRAQVDRAVGEVMQRYGRIDGVLFGAGVLDDRFIAAKDETSLAKVYQPKVAGAENVLAAVHAQAEPRFFVFFSSLSSAVGNRGQTDYSAANDYLDIRALALNAARPGQYLSINWGPWAGAGMIDGSLQKHLEGMGVFAISRHQGVDFLFDALGEGKSSGQVVAMCVNDDAVYWKEA
ncbi:type I polyketide synthase [Tahibacter amnicola]|uniref:SDR family NAD(P)-dependent oxidoreductase n=1 Tax=Tahibacter amnicola TaxID=2976241 RepID=A0ABY6BG56_9GAMM|nr:type I polyketide synthase [Tahibacter amnicola]UXI69008.1 SDR family NAD(P)-dependent oxidoreductase [Tahibacter amnicola]